MVATLAYPASVDSSVTPRRPGSMPAPPPSGVRLTGGFCRSRSTIERRTPVLRSGPASFGELPYGTPPSVELVEPFDHAPEQVPARTRAIVACGCDPDAHCTHCAGTRHIASWIEIECTRSQRVHVSGDDELLESHVDVFDPDDFERGDWRNQLVHQAWFRGVPEHLAADLQPELAANERVVWLLVQTFVG